MSNQVATARIEGIQSIDRAVAVLEYLGQHGDSNVSDVAHQLGVHKSTASRMLAALQTHGLVEVTQLRGRYKLGYGLVRLAGMVGSKLDVVAQGSAICAELAEATGETVTLGTSRDDIAITIHQVSSGSSSITLDSWLGRPTPLHATSSGKVLLAQMSAERRDRVLAAELESFTPRTVVDAQTLRRELVEIARSGFAVTSEEFEQGLTAVAAPVFGHHGTVICALAVSGPSYRMSAATLRGLVPRVTTAAAELSLRMGHRG